MRVVLALAGSLALAALSLSGCAGRSETDGGDAAGGSAGGGLGGLGAFGGDPCRSVDGVRLCGGTAAACGWVGADECPGGGCARPFDRVLGGEAVAGLCFSDLADNGSRPCWGCNDGEVCVEREKDELVCVPASVCASLWELGAKGVCRYADLSAYDGRPLPILSKCPSSKPESLLCGGACSGCPGVGPPACTGRSPDHPQGFCTSFEAWCALSGTEYVQSCAQGYCGVFHVAPADQPAALRYGRCLGLPYCEMLAEELPGGFDCYDKSGSLVTGSAGN